MKKYQKPEMNKSTAAVLPRDNKSSLCSGTGTHISPKFKK